MINFIHGALIVALIATFWPLGVVAAVVLAAGALVVWLITLLRE